MTGFFAGSRFTARSFFGTLGASAGLFLVPRLAAQRGLIGSYGNALALASLALVPAVILLNRLPETSGRELEELAIDPGCFEALPELRSWSRVSR